MSLNPFLNNFDSQRDMENAYSLEEGTLDGCKFIVADYTYENYSGHSFVLFIKDGKLYENHGSHCSCYGLEGQWDPEETNAEELLGRLERGGLSEYEYVIREGLKYFKEGRKVKKVVYFEAADGKRFDNEAECERHEFIVDLAADMVDLGLVESTAVVAAQYFVDNYNFSRK